MIVGVSPADPTCELTRTEYVRVGTQHALLKRIVEAADDRHGDRHAADRRLVAGAAPRVAHENNVIGTMNILAACGGPDSPVRKFVFKSSAHYYGCERDDPAFFTEAMRAPAPAAHAARAGHRRGRARRRRVRASATADVTVTVLRFVNGLGPDLAHQPHGAAVAARRPVDPRLRPALPVHRRGRHRRRAGARDAPRPARHLQRRRRRRAGALGDHLAARQAARADAAAVGDGRRRRARCAAPALRIPPEMLQQLRYGRALDNRRLKAAGYAFRATSRETVQAFAEHLRVRGLRAGAGRGLPVRARRRGVPALEPRRARATTGSASSG